MSGQASADVIASIRDGSAWNGDARAQTAALDALVARKVPLDEAALIPDGIRAYVVRKLSGVNSLETVPTEALGDTDEAAAERCRRLLIGWAREAGIDRVRWIVKVEGDQEADVAAYATHEADGLLRLVALIRHKHRNESEWDPGTPDEFAAGMLMRQAQDLSVTYRTRGMFGTSWKPYGKLSAATQGKFEGHVMRMVTIARARRSAQVAAFARKFDDRPLPTTQKEADQLMADMISEAIGRRVEPPTRDPLTSDPVRGSDDRSPMRDDAATASEHASSPSTFGADGASAPTTAPTEARNPTAQDIGPADIAGRTYSEVIAGVKAALTGDFKHDSALIMSVTAACGGHPQAKEILRELGRMFHAIAPDDVKAKLDGIADGYESGFDEGLTQARALIGARDVAGARRVLEDLILRYGSGTGLYQDDSVSEYRHFRNDFEAALYVRLYPSTKTLRKLPQDRATLYSLYGAVLLELRDADRAEAALREALRANPVSTDAMFELGEVMKLTGRKRECRELTLRALEVAYTGAALGRGYRNLGYLAVEDADYDLAVTCYCMSLRVDPDHAQAAQSELFYVQQAAGRMVALPDPPTVDAKLAAHSIQVVTSQLVTELMIETQLRRATS
jgi:tetratricopeptide (TPR) repeat protein